MGACLSCFQLGCPPATASGLPGVLGTHGTREMLLVLRSIPALSREHQPCPPPTLFLLNLRQALLELDKDPGPGQVWPFLFFCRTTWDPGQMENLPVSKLLEGKTRSPPWPLDSVAVSPGPPGQGPHCPEILSRPSWNAAQRQVVQQESGDSYGPVGYMLTLQLTKLKCWKEKQCCQCGRKSTGLGVRKVKF